MEDTKKCNAINHGTALLNFYDRQIKQLKEEEFSL
jgi:hypothetical protein